MAKRSKFEGAVASFNFSNKKVNSGTKVSAHLNPTLNIGTVKDKFVCDSKCQKLMEIGTGKRVIMIDNKVEESFMVKIGEVIDSKEARFLITPGYTKAGKEVGALLGKNAEFSYGVVWSAIIMNKPEITEVAPKDLEALELVIRRDTEGGKVSTISNTKISYTVAAIVDAEGIQQFATMDEEEGVEIIVPIFALIDRTEEDHEAKSAGTSIPDEATDKITSAE